MSSLEESPTTGAPETGKPTVYNNNANNGSHGATNIRTYLVLLHDCLAIKFVPERESCQNTNRNFPNRSQSSLGGCCNCSYSPYELGTLQCGNIGNTKDGKCDRTSVRGCNTTVATSLANNPCQDDSCNKAPSTGCSHNNISNSNGGKRQKDNWKCSNLSNHHPHQKPTSNEEVNDREDHQECQLYRHQANQMSYPHESINQSHQLYSSLKANNDNNESEINGPTAHQPNHHIHPFIVNSNKSDHSSSNKGEYDIMATHGTKSCVCSLHSPNNIHWESSESKYHHQNAYTTNNAYLKKQQQRAGPTLSFNNSPQAYNDHLNHHHPSKTTSSFQDDAIYSVNNGTCRSSKLRHLLEGNNSNALLNRVDHSMQALFLYKEFREINLQCFWNSAVHDAFKNLEYKGSIVPSTILVGSSIRKHLTTLKTAWSRKMLRSPAGYSIDFLGEIEELIADPIAKSHFVPLSDSLCWTIHELTSAGQEAFVDDIYLSLSTAFPGMALPTKELIYQTLEKLTRERKIYQTAQGYFVVTPDTHRYIMSTEPLLMQAASTDYQMNATTANLLRNAILFQQAAMQSSASPAPQAQQDESNEHINEKITEKENHLDTERDTLASPSPDPDTYSLPYGTFRRYNSLRIRKDASGTTTGCLPRRTLSMRLPKSKKKNGNISSHAGSAGVDQLAKRADVTDSFQNLDASQSSTVNKQLLSRRRKHKSFLSRLLSFRSVRKISGRKDKTGRNVATKGQPIARSDKSSNEPINEENNIEEKYKEKAKAAIKVTSPNTGRNASLDTRPSTNKVASTSTQTSFSLENVNTDLAFLSLATTSKASTLEREDSDSGRCTDSHSDADAEITAALNRGLTPTLHDHRHHLHLHSHAHDSRRRELVGRSHSSCNVYEKIESDLGLKVDVDECDGRSPRSPSSQMSVSPSPSTFTTASAIYNRACSSNKPHFHSRCHSSASSSGYSYRDFYNLYRRRYPSYQQSTPTSLESADMNEGLRFRPQQPIRYPPRTFERKQIFYEINRGSFKEKKPSRSNKTVSILCNASDSKNGASSGTFSKAGQHNNVESMTLRNIGSNDNGKPIEEPKHIKSDVTTTCTKSSGPMTTILSQTLKNTTNLELEFSLPLGNIFSAAIANAGKREHSTTSPASNEQLRPEPTNESGSHTSEIKERECTLSEVNTMVNDLFTIKSFVKSNPLNDELSSTIEFKTRGNHVGGSSVCSNNTNNPNNSSKTTYRIEAVSSKPFADSHTKFHRESEII